MTKITIKEGDPIKKACTGDAYTLPDRSIICATDANADLQAEPTADNMSICEIAFVSSKSTKQKSIIEGYDYFRMAITAEGLIYLPGLDYTADACKQGEGGKGCAGEIAKNGWKLDYTNLE